MTEQLRACREVKVKAVKKKGIPKPGKLDVPKVHVSPSSTPNLCISQSLHLPISLLSIPLSPSSSLSPSLSLIPILPPSHGIPTCSLTRSSSATTISSSLCSLINRCSSRIHACACLCFFCVCAGQRRSLQNAAPRKVCLGLRVEGRGSREMRVYFYLLGSRALFIHPPTHQPTHQFHCSFLSACLPLCLCVYSLHPHSPAEKRKRTQQATLNPE